MKQAYTQLSVPLYFTKGTPTCASNFVKKDICPFLKSSALGTRHHCGLLEDDTKVGLATIYEEEGFLVPAPYCPTHYRPDSYKRD